jgi:ABC-type phosphate transport system substrate-binding protein
MAEDDASIRDTVENSIGHVAVLDPHATVERAHLARHNLCGSVRADQGIERGDILLARTGFGLGRYRQPADSTVKALEVGDLRQVGPNQQPKPAMACKDPGFRLHQPRCNQSRERLSPSHYDRRKHAPNAVDREHGIPEPNASLEHYVIGATTTMSVAADPRNLEFKIVAKNGRLIGQVNAYRLGSTPGFLALAKNEADLVWTGRRIADEEEQIMTAAGIANMRAPGNEHVWALDGIVVLVAKENPVEALSLEELSKIFAGEITDWSELGLPPGKINLYAPTAEQPAWLQFDSDVMKPYGRKISPSAKRMVHSTEWADRVSEDPQGIVVSILAMVRRARPINIRTTCGMIVQPTVFNIKTEEYPLSRRMLFYTVGEPKNPLARALLAFAMSPQLQPIVRDAQFVDQEPSILPFQAQTARVAAAVNVAYDKADDSLMRRFVKDLQSS